jgi:hypothetical protein
LEKGLNVRTNIEYFEMYGRVVYGEVEKSEYINIPEATLVRVTSQTGKIIPEYQGNPIIMLTKDLEII